MNKFTDHYAHIIYPGILGGMALTLFVCEVLR